MMEQQVPLVDFGLSPVFQSICQLRTQQQLALELYKSGEGLLVPRRFYSPFKRSPS